METHSPIRLPKLDTLLRCRASRLHELAQARAPLADYLGWMAGLTELQQSLLADFPAPPLPDAEPGRPPLAGPCEPLGHAGRQALRGLAAALTAADGPAQAVGNQLRQAADGELECWGQGLLNGEAEIVPPGAAPLLAAALQLRLASQAGRLDPAPIGQPDPPYACPVCGALPAAAVLQAGGAASGLRYLCCGFCLSAWQQTRSQCVLCHSARAVAYYAVEGSSGAVRAEACADCRVYLKLLDHTKEPRLDSVADDLASLPLDWLLAEAGYRRLGFNPFLLTAAESA